MVGEAARLTGKGVLRNQSVVEIVIVVACRGVKALEAEEPMENSIDEKSQ